MALLANRILTGSGVRCGGSWGLGPGMGGPDLQWLLIPGGCPNSSYQRVTTE